MLHLLSVWALFAAYSGTYVVTDASGGDIKSELETAIASYSEIVIDSGSYTLSGDVLVTHPISIKIMPGAMIAFASSPTLDDGQHSQEPSNLRYGTGMFVLKGPAQSSRIECLGRININLDNIPDQGGEPQHVSFVFLQGASRTKITGSCDIQKAFNGITVVDSHDVYIQGVHLSNPPLNENAAVDVEASDRIYVVDVTADSYEEVVDFNGLSFGGYVSVFGELIVENVLEINNSIGIRGQVFAENSASILVEQNYSSTYFETGRWSLLHRDYITNSNNIINIINLGGGAEEPPPPPPPPPPPGTLVSVDNAVQDTNNLGNLGNYRSATEFQLTAGSVITGVGIRGSRGVPGVTGTFKVEIWQGGTNPTNGTLIKTQTFSTNALPPYTSTPNMEPLMFTTETGLLPSGLYYIVVHILTGGSNDVIRWSINFDNPYANGMRWYGATGWSNQPTIDHNFEIYGYVN